MAKELAKVYDPALVEDRLYDFWQKKKYFHAEIDHRKKTYTIVIPQGFFILGTEFDQHSSKRTVVTFRIDPLAAIGHISTDSTLADDTVYTLSGQKLGSRATLRQLPAGVYVIGGRKVVVR